MLSHRHWPLLCVMLLASPGHNSAKAADLRLLHSFGLFTNGANPYAAVTRDASGNFYGTTDQGGQANVGVVFKIDASGNETVLHSFSDGADGANPYAPVLYTSTGEIFGTTYAGGKSGFGVVFKIDSGGHFSVLHSFTGGTDGANPYSGVVADSEGNLYGTCSNGGASGLGIVYEITSAGKTSILHNFTGGADGSNPRAALTFGPGGYLYGATYTGGAKRSGVIFKMTTAGAETVLHAFAGGTAGVSPSGSVVFDSSGNMYGVANDTIFEYTAGGTYKILHTMGCEDGGGTTGGVVLDSSGNIYGATNGCTGGAATYGGVYRLDTSGSLTLMYIFPGASQPGIDISSGPNGSIFIDSQGNVYGTTPYGGVVGMVYTIPAGGRGSPYYVFPGAPAGSFSYAGATLDAKGDLYGATQGGGAANAGVIYKVTPSGAIISLYQFTGGADGKAPESNVVLDSSGNIYGTTSEGGAYGAGVIFKLSRSGNFTLLYTFTGGADGGLPNGVVLDGKGNLYGTTQDGGNSSLTGAQEGVVFKLDPSGTETVLHSFTGLADGGGPTSGVILDSAGNLYGTTFFGGNGLGVVYELSPNGVETVLHALTYPDDGGGPYGGVIRDSLGNLYGTAVNFGPNGGGVVFKVDPAGNYTVLYGFSSSGIGGSAPFAGVIQASDGNLYGTATASQNTGCLLGCGVIYMLSPTGQEAVLYNFTGGSDGSYPYAGLTMDLNGNIYGTATFGGRAGAGVIYELSPPF